MVYSACSPAMVLDWSAGRWGFWIIEKRNAHKAAVRHAIKQNSVQQGVSVFDKPGIGQRVNPSAQRADRYLTGAFRCGFPSC